jgi:hypothetical protein
LTEIDSLNTLNNELRAENEQITDRYNRTSRTLQQVSQEKEQLSEKVSLAAQLVATNINAKAVNDRGREQSRLSRSTQFVVNFTIARNITTEPGERTVYVRILTPDGTVDGSYKIEGDVYTESIINSFNKSQEGKDNPLQIKLSHDNFMYLRWFQPIDEFGVEQNRWVEEIWQRVLIEDLEVSNVDLRQELKSLLDDEELIKQVLD